jgi:hypothetical protein
MKVHTRQTVHDLIQSQWESDLPDRVLVALAKFHGKNITTRIETHLNTDMPGHEWRIFKHYGWTSLQNEAYWRHDGKDRKDGIDLMLVRSEASVPLDLTWVERENAAYFDARKTRNHARMEAMNTRGTLDALALAMNNAERAIELLTDAKNRLDDLTKYGETLNPDRYTFQRACGLTDVDGRDYGDRQFKGRVA